VNECESHENTYIAIEISSPIDN